MLRKSFLTTIAAVAFSTALTPAFAGGTGDMGHRPAPVYHPAAPVEVPTQVIRSCEGPALREGQWTFTARAGIAPTSDGDDKARVRQTFVNGSTYGSTYDPVYGPTYGSHGSTYDSHGSTHGVVHNRFKHHNDLAFATGFDIGYVPMDNVEVFFNFDYAYSGGSKKHLRNSISDHDGTIDLSTRYKQGNLNSYGFHIGGRYFFELDDCNFSPFVGAKLGVSYRNHDRHNVRVVVTQNNSTLINGLYRSPLHRDTTGFSAGIQAGLDYCVSDPVSLFIMGEAIGITNSNSHVHKRLVFTDAPRSDRLYTYGSHKIGSTFTFPITVGVKVRM
ncbi:MAG: hypothetical protein Q8L85_06665 [Alphaproteobacteria bacterium]|nr:hypothetical protein [Alphaproteobacteria bacterium]